MDRLFASIANRIARAAGQAKTFFAASLGVVIWGMSGPIFGFSDTWQLVINTSTTVITFLMVFLIQNTQNRDGAAIQAKLDEIIRTGTGSNTFIGIEHLSQSEVDQFRERCERAAAAGARTVQAAREQARSAASTAA
jgi:low affinity Fe/Cu permease